MKRCPFCNDEIKDNSKFCNNCGANLTEFEQWLVSQSGGKITNVHLKPKKTDVSLGRKVTKIIFSLFVLSIILFFTLIFSNSSRDLHTVESFQNYVRTTLLSGALFFIAMVISTIISGNITIFGKDRIPLNNKRKFMPPKWLELLPLVLVLIGVVGIVMSRSDIMLKRNTYKPQNVNNYKSVGTAPEIAEKVPVEKVNNNTPVVKEITQTDQVQCNIHVNCGGGYKMMSAAECSNTICCSIHKDCGGGFKIMSKNECSEKTCCGIDGKWSYISRSKCVEKQKEEYGEKYEAYLNSLKENNNYNYVPPIQSTVTYPTNATNDDIQCSYGSTYLGRMSYEKCLNEIKNEKEKLLQKCISDAAEAREDAEISWRNTARSYGIISSSEFLVRLNQINSTYESIVNSCKSVYGD